LMWQLITEKFRDSPQRLRVAQAIIRHGLRVNGPGDIRCASIKIPLKSIGDALNTDRRTVRATTETICEDEELFRFFSRLRPAGPSLDKVAEIFGFGVVTIYVRSPKNPGILSEVASTIANYGVAIRQVIAEDVAIYPDPCLKVITEETLSGAIINVLTSIEGVSRVVIEN